MDDLARHCMYAPKPSPRMAALMAALALQPGCPGGGIAPRPRTYGFSDQLAAAKLAREAKAAAKRERRASCTSA